MSDTENTLRNESQNTEGQWIWPVIVTLFFALLVSIPLLYFLKGLFGSLFMFFATPIGYLWEIVGVKWVGFLLLGAALSGGCLLFKGSPSGKEAGGCLLALLFLFTMASLPGASTLHDLLGSNDKFNKLSASEVQEMAGAKTPTLTEKTVQSLVAGTWGQNVSKNECVSFQRSASESPAFKERYVLFVNGQRIVPGAPVQCKWFSLNHVKVGYNARYAPNGLVAQLEAFEASRKK